MAKKTTTGGPAKKKPATTPARPGNAMQVRVRMYRQGLGDCYLLTFGSGTSAKHVLIDCGSLGTTTNHNAMVDIVDSIRTVTNGHLDVLVATHEHKDHLSGFASQRDVFTNMTIDRCWVAWTENPADQTARGLKKYDNDLGLAARAGVRAMRAIAASGVPGTEELGRRADQADQVLGFFGDDDDPLGATFAKTMHEAMELVRSGFGRREAEYLNPGTLVNVADWLPDFRVYVLGPPRSPAAIADTGEEGGSDLYPYPAAGILAAASAAANDLSCEQLLASLGSDEERDSFAKEVPFDARFLVSDAATLNSWNTYREYSDKEQAWRRVDADWLGFSSVLALQLDNRTNNTSLVLAFERISDGKVLLFPADAQHGNWQSWSTPRELTWTVRAPDGSAKSVSTTDLLKRTVFYKVGHHSSHNATARTNGLEKMEHNALVAFIPVDRQVALAKNWNTMPTRSLYKRLMEKCNGRVARSDTGWVTGTGDGSEFSTMFTAAEWQGFEAEQSSVEAAGAVAFDPLFVDYTLR